jgi:predicted AAA+ superfamily ATPase
MYRTINKTLLQWKSKPQRKPLVLLGARQVGKTYALKELGLQAFKNTVYLNFEANENLKTIFDLDL